MIKTEKTRHINKDEKPDTNRNTHDNTSLNDNEESKRN